MYHNIQVKQNSVILSHSGKIYTHQHYFEFCQYSRYTQSIFQGWVESENIEPEANAVEKEWRLLLDVGE